MYPKTNGFGNVSTLPPAGPLALLHGFGIGGSQMHFQSSSVHLVGRCKSSQILKIQIFGWLFLVFIFLCEKLGKGSLAKNYWKSDSWPLFSICVCVCLHAWTSEAFSEAQNEGSDYCGPNEPCQSGIICDNEISLCSGKAAFSEGNVSLLLDARFCCPHARLCWHKKYPHFVPVEPTDAR